jgi:hypothetical protein
VATADLNGDGNLDLVVANLNSSNVSVLLGNGNGTFAPARNFDVPSQPASVAIGDLNGDDVPDLVVISRSTASVYVSLGFIPPTVTAGAIAMSGGTGLGGAFKIGDTVTATWNDTATGDNNTKPISTVTVDFSQFGGGTAVTAIDHSGIWTATYTIAPDATSGVNRNVRVTATDGSGHATTTAGTTNAILVQAPRITSASNPVTGINQASVAISGTAADGSAISVTATDGTHTTAAAATSAYGGSWTVGLDVSYLNAGPITYQATATDSVGGTQTAQQQATKTSVAQVALTAFTTVTAANQRSVQVSGTAQNGARIWVTATDGIKTAGPAITTASDGTWTVHLNVSRLKDGTITYRAVAGDHLGKSQTNGQSTKDTVAHVRLTSATHPVTAANQTNVTLAGTAENGSTISVTATDGRLTTTPAFASVTAGTWIVHLDVSSLKDGVITYRVTATDSVGNQQTVSRKVTKDTLVNKAISKLSNPLNSTDARDELFAGLADDWFLG